MMFNCSDNFLIEIFRCECSLSFPQTFHDQGHEFIIVALLVFEVSHESQIISEKIMIVWICCEETMEKLFRILMVFVIFCYVVSILHQNISQQIHILYRLILGQKSVE